MAPSQDLNELLRERKRIEQRLEKSTGDLKERRRELEQAEQERDKKLEKCKVLEKYLEEMDMDIQALRDEVDHQMALEQAEAANADPSAHQPPGDVEVQHTPSPFSQLGPETDRRASPHESSTHQEATNERVLQQEQEKTQG